jgi:hypothetical protein
MHNGARATLAIGTLFTIIGLIVVALGVGTAAGAFDLEENAEMIGSTGSFVSNDDDWGFEIFVKGEITEEECESISVTITDSTGSDEDEFWGTYYDEDCYSNAYEYEGYTYIGSFSIVNDNGVYNVDASTEVIVVDTAEGAGEAIGGGLLAALCGLPALICGILFLLLGGVLGVALKDKQNVQIQQQQPLVE